MKCVVGYCCVPALETNIAAHKVLAMDPSESAHSVPHFPPPPEGESVHQLICPESHFLPAPASFTHQVACVLLTP